jgi:hypothetical protein
MSETLEDAVRQQRDAEMKDVQTSALTQRELDEANADPVKWAENLTTIDGDPVDYSEEYRFWKEPMRAFADPDAPEEHIWNFARGLGKTEQSARVKWHSGTTQPMRDCIYSTPRMRQIRTFQKTVVRRMIHGSRGDPPFLLGLLDGNEVHVQRNDLKGPPAGPGSVMETRSAWNDGSQIQGYHGHRGVADEMQQWTRAAIENFKNAVDKGNQRILYTGTPNYEGTVYHEYWLESDQREWFFDCPECDAEQTLTLDSIELVETDPKSWERHCKACGEQIDKETVLLDGYWKPTNPGGIRRGYHFSQLASPRHDLDYIMREFERATTPEGDFVRYRLAQFYSGAAKPIPEQAIQKVADDTLALRHVGLEDEAHFIGVDHGGGESSDTIAVVLHVTDRDEKFPTGVDVDTVELINADTRAAERRAIADLMIRFNIPDRGRGVFDMGYGSEGVELFQNGDANPNQIPEHGWGSLVLGHRFGSVNRETGDWPYMRLEDRVLKAYQPPWANRVVRLFPSEQGYDDTSHADEVDYQVKRTDNVGIRIPYHDDPDTREIIDYWTDHLTAIKREFKESETTGKRKEYFTTFGENQKDDGFYALLYAYVAATVGPTSTKGGITSVGGKVG